MKFGSVNGFSNLVEVREILEPEIAALAATRITDEYITAMREAMEIMEIRRPDHPNFGEKVQIREVALVYDSRLVRDPEMLRQISELVAEKGAQFRKTIKINVVFYP